MNTVDSRNHLFAHAHAMGGWLSATYITDDYQAAMSTLITIGLFAHIPGGDGTGPGRYQLTEVGRDIAADVAYLP